LYFGACVLVFGSILGGQASPEILYETSRGRNSEKIERRTSNVQHRTLNIDDATLYRFYNKRTAEHLTAEL
jgi:hypothetical protein